MPGSRRHAGKVQDSILLCRSMPDTVMERDTAVLEFIGDVMLHRAQIENACREDGSFDFSGYFSGIQDDLRKADIAVANMEFTLEGEPYTGYPAFSAPDSYAEYMAGCGIDVFLTANNHILDKGRKGLLRTLSVYREMERKYGIRMTGSAETVEEAARVFPLMMNVNGIKIAFVNFTYGTNIRIPERFPGTFLMDKEQILKAMRHAERAGADFIVALPHWGEEYRTKHSDAQEEMARWLAGNGADLIVGTHPHVVQDVMYIENGGNAGCSGKTAVIYSLGNAISNMSARDTQIGLMAEVTLVKERFGDTECPVPRFTFLWSSLPGRLKKSHATVRVKDYIGKRSEWMQEYEYDKMVSTYCRIRESTGIEDGGEQ